MVDVSKMVRNWLPRWEPITTELLKAIFSEYLHTTIFLFVTIGAISFGCHTSGVGLLPGGRLPAGAALTEPLGNPETCRLTDSRVLSIATVFGFAIAILVYSSATFSGGHLNPAVTVGLLNSRKITLFRAVPYIIAQMAGATTGAALVYAIDINGWRAANGGANGLIPAVNDAAGWGMEALLTGTLVFVVLAATDEERAAVGAHLPVLAPFAIGLTVFVAHLVAIPIDGCSINPARSFGPALISGNWENQWIFWVGPLSGAVIASAFYERFFRTSAKHRPVLAPGTDEPQHGDTVQLPAFVGGSGVKQTHHHSVKDVSSEEDIESPKAALTTR